MKPEIERDLLIKDILTLAHRVYTQSGEIPVALSDENLGSMSVVELTALKNQLRDLARSLGGTKE